MLLWTPGQNRGGSPSRRVDLWAIEPVSLPHDVSDLRAARACRLDPRAARGQSKQAAAERRLKAAEKARLENERKARRQAPRFSMGSSLKVTEADDEHAGEE